MPILFTLKDIVGLTDAELARVLRSFGVSVEREVMMAEAVRRAAARLVGADNPDPALIDKVMGAAEAAVRRELQVTAKQLTRDYMSRELGVQGETLERWQAVMDKATCESCSERHGEKQTHAEWLADGEPGSANLICNGNCRCILVPDEAYTGDYEKGDVQVEITFEGEGYGRPVERQAGR